MIDVKHDGKLFVNVGPNDFSRLGIPESTYQAALIEEAWRLVRQKRDALLLATDYAIMPDYPLTEAQKGEVTAYRQALRDIPDTYASPDAVEWPAKPEALA